MKTKWLWLGLVIALLSALLAFNWFGCAKKKLALSNDNLLIITLDTTRADNLGAWGYKQAQTPNLDALARDGVMFANCSSPVPLTLPAHCSFFTGRYPPAHGVRNNGSYFLPAGETTLAEIFKARDYQTSAVIASFVLLGKFGLKQGFDAYDDSLDTHEM
jgi:choline-sulfatase